jgi:hypothetical protein
MPTFKEIIDSKDDAELGAMMRSRFERLIDAHKSGMTDTHPSVRYNEDNAVLRAHRAATDGSGSGLGARELEEKDKPNGDDPPSTSGSAGVPQRNGASVAQDRAAIAELRRAVPGYGRLR